MTTEQDKNKEGAREKEDPERKRTAEKLRKFEVVAFGCHDQAYERLAEFIQDESPGIQTFMFVEYFCVSPVSYPQWKSKKKTDREVFFPFIRRIVDDNQFLWVPSKVQDKKKSDAYTLMPKVTGQATKDFTHPETFRASVKPGYMASKLLDWWAGPKWFKREGRRGKYSTEAHENLIQPFGPTEREKYYKVLQEGLNDEGHGKPSNATKALNMEYGLLVHPWDVAKQSTASLILFPLATDAVFYGYLLIVLPEDLVFKKNAAPKDHDKENERNEKGDKILAVMAKMSKELYLPVLALLAESMLEASLAKAVEGDEREYKGKLWTTRARRWFDKEDIPFFRCNDTAVDYERKKKKDEGKPVLHKKCPQEDRPYDASCELPLHRCWRWREQLLHPPRRRRTEEDRREFLRRLPLTKYFVASPGLVENMKLVMGANFEMPKATEKLEAALVYGGPGSGKDVMAQLVSVFSEQYFERAMYTVNMAAIRPPAITGPLLQGLHVSGPQKLGKWRERGDGTDIEQPTDMRTHVQGLFLQAKWLEEARSTQRGGDGRGGATFILDELNSLDVDLQGVLLRVLEQGEVMPLGGLSKAYVQHLIVGVVNEDPEQITQEEELRNLLVEKGKLGSLVSGLLYETLRRSRRLRDDLYHRLKRKLYIRVPEIKDRRPDIPMLFYVEACKEAKRLDKEPSVLVELGAYRLLMDPALTWPGNVRQIQAMAEKAVRAASEDATTNEAGKNEASTDEADTEDLSILQSHVQAALEDEFRDVYGREEKRSRKNGYGVD